MEDKMLPEIAIMIEGQNGLNWARWKNIALAVEEAGYVGLYRSDHFTNANPPNLDSLELWISLAWLASHTQRIEFGPLVTPVSFRHPTLTARMAAAVDDLSGGRLILGLGAGWQEREHEMFGFELLDVQERFRRLEEGLEVIVSMLQKEGPQTFEGQYYRLQEAEMLPRPQRQEGPPILIGGNGKKYSLPLAARYASEWNGIFATTEKFQELNEHLDSLLEEQGRSPGSVRRSMMTGLAFGVTDEKLRQKTGLYGGGKLSLDELRERGLVAGGPEEVRSQLENLHEAGVQRVMLQWLDLDDVEGLHDLAQALN
jgi:F420-dependent oxidoreductase-like protein